MNAEGIFALAFIGVLFLGPGRRRDESRRGTHESDTYQRRQRFESSWAPGDAGPKPRRQGGSPGPTRAWLLVAVVAIAFAPYLSFPFLADDYSHIQHARAADLPALWAHFAVPETDRFFRPLGYLSYALDAQWAGTSPTFWRASNLALHLVNTLLVYLLCLRLRLSPIAALAGGLLFGLHGSRPEVVTWVSARFDLLAVLFGLLSILCLVREWRAAAAAAVFLAALSKESAYVVPLLGIAVLWFERRPWREIARLTWPSAAVAVAVFAYRWWLLGGIGGYRNAANGSPTVFNFRFASTLKALFLRFWAAMLFPINWTGGLEVWMAVALAAGIVAMIVIAWGGAPRRTAALAVLFATVCSLPVHQFLSIGPDLEKSRVIYFGSVGLAILFAAAMNGRGAQIAMGVMLVFQVAALEHNLAIWKRVGYLAEATCRAAADAGAVVTGLPNVVDGVYFLHTGYPECVEMRAQTARPSAPPDVWVWNEKLRTIEPARH